MNVLEIYIQMHEIKVKYIWQTYLRKSDYFVRLPQLIINSFFGDFLITYIVPNIFTKSL